MAQGNLLPSEHYVGGLAESELLVYWQHQTDGDNCGPFSLAMATNLRKGSNLFKGDIVEDEMESKWWKPKGFGVPAWLGYKKALAAYNPGANVAQYKWASLDDLKQALVADKICIVEVSWQTTCEILKMLFAGRRPTVGHYMVVVGYDENGFYFLDPGFDPYKGTNRLQFYFYTNFEQIWLKQPNIFIPSGTMFTVESKSGDSHL